MYRPICSSMRQQWPQTSPVQYFQYLDKYREYWRFDTSIEEVSICWDISWCHDTTKYRDMMVPFLIPCNRSIFDNCTVSSLTCLKPISAESIQENRFVLKSTQNNWRLTLTQFGSVSLSNINYSETRIYIFFSKQRRGPQTSRGPAKLPHLPLDGPED